MYLSLLLGIFIFLHIEAFNVDLLAKLVNMSRFQITTILHCSSMSTPDIIKLSKQIPTVEFLDIDTDAELFLMTHLYHANVLLDLRCESAERLLDLTSSQRLFNTSRSFIAFGRSLNESQELLLSQDVNVNSELMIINEEEEIYKVKSSELRRGMPLYVNQIGAYNGGELSLNPSKINNYNLDGTTIFVAINVPRTPSNEILLEYIKGENPGHSDSIHRLGIQIINLVVEMWNGRVHYVRATTWGYLNKEKQFNGCMGLLQRGDANVSTAALLYVPARHPIIDSGFSVPRFRQMFIFRHPRHGKGVKTLRNVFLLPLSDEVWYCIFAVTFLCFLVLMLASRFEKGTITFTETLVTVVGAMAQQGIIVHFASLHARIITLFLLIMSFLCFQYYSASIVGSLLTPTPKSITDMKSLRESNLKVVLEDVPSSIPAFLITNNALSRDFYEKRIVGKEVFASIDDGLALVKKGGYTFFTYVDYSYDLVKERFTASEIDDLQEIPIYPERVHANMYFPVKKYSPVKELVRVGVQRLIEHGLASYWTRRWYSEKPLGDLNKFKTAVVDFYRCSTIIYLLLLGFLISLLVFGMEVLVHTEMYKKAKDGIFARVENAKCSSLIQRNKV